MNVGSLENDFSIQIYDTTLRDGAQTPGLSLSLSDKLKITKILDSLGVDYIEGGWPGSNSTDTQYFSRVPKTNAKIAAFASTARSLDIEQDSTIRNLVESNAEVFTIFGKANIEHVKKVLKKEPEQYLKIVSSTMKYLKKTGKEIIFDAELFFSGFEKNSSYALDILKAAEEADTIVLCDTFGGALPEDIKLAAEKTRFLNKKLGIHCHNDSGLALANSLIAVENGAKQIQVTANGIGERCGNTDLVQLLTALYKMGFCKSKILRNLKQKCWEISKISGFGIPENYPYIGENAFSHKGGTHTDSAKKGCAYHHIKPELVGNKENYPISEQSGRSAIVMKAREIGFELNKKDPRVARILNKIEREIGDCQFYLLVLKELEKQTNIFEIISVKILDEISKSGSKPICEIVLKIGKQKIKTKFSSTKGGINAFDLALKKTLKKIYPKIDKIKLVDYKVSAIGKGTDAKVKTKIIFSDNKNEFNSVGYSADQNRAAIQAIKDAYKYFLARNNRCSHV